MIKKIEAFERVVSAILFIFILLAILWQIISRKVLSNPSLWSDELSRLLFVYMCMLGCHIAQRENIHVRIDAIMSKFSNKGKLILEFITNLVMTIIFIIITYHGWNVTSRVGINDKLVTLNLSVSWITFALVFLGIIMCLELVFQMINIIRKKEVIRAC